MGKKHSLMGASILTALQSVREQDYSVPTSCNAPVSLGEATTEVALGFVPVVGSFISLKDLHCDIQNWEWTFSHTGIATLDAIGIIPEMGGLTRGLKMAVKLEKAGDATRIVGKMTDINGETFELVGKYIKTNIETTIDFVKLSGDIGHVIERHVGLSKADMVLRLANKPQISKVSSFYDVLTGIKTTMENIKVHQIEIQKWLKDPSKKQIYAFTLEYAEEIGEGVLRSSNDQLIKSKIVETVLRYDNDNGGFSILTSYPLLP